jgi:hypothetical protein
MGYGSMFNRRKSYKMAKTKSAEALERIQKTKVNHREKVTQRLKQAKLHQKQDEQHL